MKLTFTTKNLPIHRFQEVEMGKIREKAVKKEWVGTVQIGRKKQEGAILYTVSTVLADFTACD